MSLYVIGDLHGGYDNSMQYLNTSNFPEQIEMSKDDVIIQLGDFGFFWDQEESKEERYWLNWLASRNYTFCFIDGNHENFDRLNQLPECSIFGGIAKYWENEKGSRIYWLQRGECYIINGKKILTMGGAQSTDRLQRTEGISWWKEEIWSHKEENKCLDTIEKHNRTFDYILSHTAPSFVIQEMDLVSYDRYYDGTSKFFDFIIKEELKFNQWHFGHFHTNWNWYNTFFCHYKSKPFMLN